MVPLLDLTRQYQAHADELDRAALAVLSSGVYILGPIVDDFEAQAARYLGVKHAIGVANGTDALQICLQALGVGPGDEVITTPFSFFSTAEVVSRVGATPVFVDIEPDTFNLDPSLIEAKITPRTRAIIPVHLFGHAAPMPQINAIARKHGLKVLEDAAQAWGSTLEMNGQSVRCGAQGDMASFSFYPTKNLGACGDAGLITTDDDTLAETARSLRVHGSRRRYYHDEIGYNSRLDALQAALLRVKLPHSDAWNDARRAHAHAYNQALEGSEFGLPSERPGARHIYHQYTLRIEASERQGVSQRLRERGVSSAIFYPVPLHLQAVYKDLGYSEGDLPGAEAAAREVLSLPIFPELREDERKQVVEALLATS
jgi:dTDP-4-amino-4,6-dideoxygalactose transaminase